MKKIYVLLAGTILLNSCGLSRYSRQVSYRNLEPMTRAIAAPLANDIRVIGPKIDTTIVYTFGKREFVRSIGDWKTIAINDAIQNRGADLLVAGSIDSEFEAGKSVKKRLGKMTRAVLQVTVTGYPAVYANFRNLDIPDTTILKYQQPQNRISFHRGKTDKIKRK